ncbi:MFS multidrug transporter-like protein [Coleophoma cylindrospora]|uniref:MFS multidrug transporter-like protein n=1 Tax=Coleophoma cylindrospora TaxID=1849047 RepID=A0A3D8RZB4_9HELO|nr:MFS multidrug transporter-like protein [Coleophoma cylindrospora]
MSEKKENPAPPSGLESAVESSRTDSQEFEEDHGEITSPRGSMSTFTWVTIIAAILSSAFLFAIDNTITAVIQPAIIHTFNDPSKLSWISVSFLLAAVGTNLLWGRLYGSFESKWLYILTIVIFEVGSAICAASPTMNALIVGRAICGVGGIGMYLGVLSLLSALTSISERPIYLAMCGVIWGLGTVLGPFIGGAFADSSATWRWGFYINLCVGALFSPVYLFLIPRLDPHPGKSFMSRLKEIDWLGALLLFGTLTTLLMGIAFGGVQYPWGSGSTISLFVVAGVVFVGLAIQQTYALATTQDRRLFPLEFLKSKEMVILFIQIACSGTVTFVPIYFIPLFYELARGDSALQAGLRLLPFILLLVTMNMVNGFGMGRFGYYMPWFTGGSALVVISSALLYTIDENTSNSAIYGYTSLLGIGCGACSQAAYSIAQALVAPDIVHLAIGFISCGQIGGAGIGVAISDAVFLNTAQNSISKLLPDVDLAIIQEIISGIQNDYYDSLSPTEKAAIVTAMVSSFDKVFVLAITGGAVALVLSLFMNRGKLNLSSVPTAM